MAGIAFTDHEAFMRGLNRVIEESKHDYPNPPTVYNPHPTPNQTRIAAYLNSPEVNRHPGYSD